MKKILAILTVLLFSGIVQSQSCLPEGIVFNTQTQVDNFHISYPGCREIMGDVRISGDNINNLNGLNLLTSISGYLEINATQYLPALQGLDNLAYIGGDLLILSNYALTGLTGMQGLVTVVGSVTISNNPVLASISALSNLEATSIADLAIHDNPVLADCSAQGICDYLSEPKGHVDIYNNAPGCKNPPDLAEHCGITLSCLPHGDYYFLSQADIDNFATDYSGCASLAGITMISGEDISSLEGLSGVTSMGMYVRIEGNQALQSLSGLEGLTHVNGSLSVSYNDALTSLAGLENLESIEGNLTIYHDSLLTDLEGLASLSSLGNMLEIGYNENLTDISALSQITSIGDMLWIGFNNSLTSLSGLDNIDPGSFDMLFLVFNPELSECDVESICEYIANQGGIIQVTDNASGCDNQQEILDACAVGVEDYPITVNHVKIYPNPASDVLFIESSERMESVCVFDSRGCQVVRWSGGQVVRWSGGQVVRWSGGQVVEGEGGKVEIPVGGLAPGLYLVRVVTGSGVFGRKVIMR